MSRAVRVAGATRDLLMVAIGVLLLVSTPPSLVEFDGSDIGTAAWALMLLVGGFTSFVGVILIRPTVETVGCFTVGGGFLVWAVAALCQPDPDRVTVAIALVFLSGTIGQIWRGLMAPTAALGDLGGR